jgi:hypothetical protein
MNDYTRKALEYQLGNLKIELAELERALDHNQEVSEETQGFIATTKADIAAIEEDLA